VVYGTWGICLCPIFIDFIFIIASVSFFDVISVRLEISKSCQKRQQEKNNVQFVSI
jgi:hypothetical protein